MYKKMERIVAFFLLGILVLSLLPVMYLGRYNHPTGDDYYYATDTHLVWEETGSIAATISEAIKGAIEDYKAWQGTYSTMFLVRLAPNVFSDTAYHYVTTALLLLLVSGIFFLLKPILCGYLKGSRCLWLLVSSVVSLICIQTVPSQGETFFWYNGSVYYTGYFALTLILFGILLRYLLKPRWYLIPISLLLAFFIAGGNYVSLLPAILIMFVIALMLGIKRKYKQCCVVLAVAVTLVAGLLISAFAPGNVIRQSTLWKIPAWKAILKSLLQGVKYFLAWARGWLWMAIAVVTPVFIKSYKGLSIKFRYPVIVIGLAYGIFCSMSCPTFYSMNSTGPARAVAIVYYGFVLTIFFCYYYLLGYVYKKIEANSKSYPVTDEKIYRNITIIATGLVLVLLLVQSVNGNIMNCTTLKAVRELASGNAQAYGQEYQERLKLLNDENIDDVVLKPHEHMPDMLYVGDMIDDPDSPVNQKVAGFYKKKSVTVDWDGNGK